MIMLRYENIPFYPIVNGHRSTVRALVSIKLREATMELFLNGAELSLEFSDFSEFRDLDKSQKHEMCSILKTLSITCLAGTVVASWSLTQELQVRPLLMNLLNSVKIFWKNFIMQ